MSHVKEAPRERPPNALYAHAGFAVLRTPLLPLDRLLEFGALARVPDVGDESNGLEEATAADKARLGAFVQQCFAHSAMREALFVASPDLHGALRKAEEAGGGAGGIVPDRALLALTRYLVRAAGRPTPFGLFAGCSVLPFGERTRLDLEGVDAYTRHSRLDMDYLSTLTRVLARGANVRRAVRLSPNSSVHAAGGFLHYVCAKLDGEALRYSLEAVQTSDAITRTFALAAAGAQFEALAQALVDDEATIDDARAFVDELIEAQLLVPEIGPTITGADAAQTLSADLDDIPGCGPYAEALRTARDRLRSIDARGVGADVASYEECAEGLRAIAVPLNPARLVQVDLYKPPAHGASLGAEVAAEAVRAADVLCRIATGMDPLVEFRERFRERYEEQEVALLEALDDENGVGLDASGGGSGVGVPTAEHAAYLRRREAWLAELRTRAARRGDAAVELDADDVRRLERRPGPVASPDSVAVVGTVLAGSPEDVDAGAFRLLVTYCSGPSGASLLGRFSHLDPGLCDRVREYLRAEERLRPDAVFAEIVHLPQGRTGNVLSRPQLRRYEIPYLGRAGVPPEQQIPLSDLTLAVAGDRLVLRSRRLQHEVIPRLSSAHNYGDRRQLPVYRFLGMLQKQGLPQHTGWDWGEHAAVAAFLPRVTMGRLILSRARWLVPATELRALASARGAERVRAARAWRRHRLIPRDVLLADGDNQLPVDLENVLGLDAFVELTCRRDSAVLLEPLALPDLSPVSGPEGRFAHEVVIPLTKVTARSTTLEPSTSVARERLQAWARAAVRGRRHFVPGSEWLYLKLYCGPGTSDRLLRTLVGPLAHEAVGAGLADQWFFVRYRDPDFHLRVRIAGRAQALYGELLPRLAALVEPLVDAGIVSRVQHDTYVREVERYGGDEGIRLAERWFFVDSECAFDLIAGPTSLGGAPADDGIDERACSAIAAVDGLFEAFELPLERRRRLLEAAVGAATAPNRRLWGEWFRRNRASLGAALSREPDAGDVGAAWRTPIMARYVMDARPVARALQRLECDGALTCSLDGVLASFAHMSVNRIVRPEHVARSEAMCYDVLGRHYQSLLARGGAAGEPRHSANPNRGRADDAPVEIGAGAPGAVGP